MKVDADPGRRLAGRQGAFFVRSTGPAVDGGGPDAPAPRPARPGPFLYALTPDTADTERLLWQVEAVLGGGARILQYRSKHPDRNLRLSQAGALLALCRAHGASFVVNDDVSIALAIGADGVHLGRDDASIATARAALGARLIGASCYGSLQRALDAQQAGADYVAFGSFFASSVKPQAPRAPLELLHAARAQLDLPIVAIGGVTLENAAVLVEAGADAVAAISALFEVADPGRAARAFTRMMEQHQKDLQLP